MRRHPLFWSVLGRRRDACADLARERLATGAGLLNRYVLRLFDGLIWLKGIHPKPVVAAERAARDLDGTAGSRVWRKPSNTSAC
jgi:hypothetical protein